MSWQSLIDEFKEQSTVIAQGGGQRSIDRQHKKGLPGNASPRSSMTITGSKLANGLASACTRNGAVPRPGP